LFHASSPPAVRAAGRAGGSNMSSFLLRQGRFPQIGGCACAQGAPATRQKCDTSLKNSKSAIKLLQVVLASARTAKTRVFASKHAQHGATHRSKCPARTAAPVAGAGHCTGCIWATAGPLHATAGSQEEPTQPSICASQLLQACCWALGVVVVEQGEQGVGKGVG
jgi:hypothetical protein